VPRKKDKIVKETFTPEMDNVILQDRAEGTPVINEDDSADINEVFDNQGQTESSTIKELFNPKNFKVKTELSHDEMSISSRLYEMSKMVYEKHGNYHLKQTVDELLVERISLNRQSRKEFVEANKDITKERKGLSSLWGGLGFGGP
jgi:hypothetical protein